jgi:hypothetical protein
MKYHKVQPCAIYKVECVKVRDGVKGITKKKKKGLCEVSPQLNDLTKRKSLPNIFYE